MMTKDEALEQPAQIGCVQHDCQECKKAKRQAEGALNPSPLYPTVNYLGKNTPHTNQE